MGSGSTGVAAIHTNRNFIGIEKDADFFLLLRKSELPMRQNPSESSLVSFFETPPSILNTRVRSINERVCFCAFRAFNAHFFVNKYPMRSDSASVFIGPKMNKNKVYTHVSLFFRCRGT